MLNGSHCDKIEKDKEVICKTFGEVGEVQGVGGGEGVGGGDGVGGGGGGGGGVEEGGER